MLSRIVQVISDGMSNQRIEKVDTDNAGQTDILKNIQKKIKE